MDDPTRVSASDLLDDFGAFADRALTAPITITRDGADRLVLLSAEEYARLLRQDRRVVASADLPDAVLDRIERTEMDGRHASLDALIPAWRP
ncbi:type II toxin-antitoxin system Phd/YefM family antitoxin [Methylobacterium sp. NEAU 140]|uniref:type II toxin-antitoxin system Phd/YefM family antitoxin n=1 Tax=Methylobacterium sp. NEAU 140 TaxID=3064945 RepID=UPI002734E6C5|nr:type II toxin-antitoxin system Phd/YefM family antitoxin [Methylobacterium sp. NEAU 140]MDP4025488.1 type II toxin-antitoxin system Phd/YefM family antitoxin [Methylobacterium sp. NEAU 140]